MNILPHPAARAHSARTPWIFRCAILALGLVPASACLGSANLLSNGDFSAWDAERPVAWTLRSPQDYKRVEGPTPSSAALDVTVVKSVPGRSGEVLQRAGVKPHTRYKLSGQLRGAAGLGVLQVKRYKDGKELDRKTSKKNAGDTWSTVEVTFQSGDADAVEALLRWGQEADDVGRHVAFTGLVLAELGELTHIGEEVPPRAVATFNSLGLYWKPTGGSAKREVAVQYREKGADAWSDALPLWFDPNEHGAEAAAHAAEYRGSIVHLKAGTTYEVKLSLAGGSERVIEAATWSDDFKIARTVVVPSEQKGCYVITEGGSAESGYVLYTPAEGTKAVWDAADEAAQNIEVNASYVIVRGLTLKNAKTHGIRLGDAHHVVVERCDISGWGETGADGQAKNLNAAIYGNAAVNSNIVVQHCDLHHPRSDSNSWNQRRPGTTSSHPIGPQGIVLKGGGGGHVIRFNRIHSDMQHMFNDGMGETKNFSYRGFPGRDTDIHDNFVSHCWDDGIEVEGANMNVRVWNNSIDMTYGALGAATTSLGPVYFFRNVYGVSRKHEGTSSNDLRGHYLVKPGNEDATWVRGRTYIFHNTTLQPPPFPGSSDIGSGAEAGIVFTSDRKQAENIVSRNNILHMRKEKNWAIRDTQLTPNNDFDYDLYDGRIMAREGAETHGIVASPRFEAAPDGRLWLVAGSPGHDAGERLPNFNDGFVGAAPDMGAVETGDPRPRHSSLFSGGCLVPLDQPDQTD
ncbi:MAG: right-handed parallel beta-helix repeat-containing protein [Kiritimatiellia bacterium]|jgi:hypothetical protein